MPDWLTPILTALDARAAPCTFFFRDDDAGWDDARLFALLDCFANHGVPLDLAVIPAALTPGLAARLLARLRADDAARPGVHQHGYAHVNHEATGRKCEFGPDRSRAAQYRDLRMGRTTLDAAFDGLADPIFTPPWNRCTVDTALCLRKLGFQALSRDVTAIVLDVPVLREVPVAVDWCRLRPTGAAPLALAERIAECIANAPRVGIMIHHAVMDRSDIILLDGLLPLLRTHPMARCMRMRELLPVARPMPRSGASRGARLRSVSCPEGFAE
jgi:predicted deacetylase